MSQAQAVVRKLLEGEDVDDVLDQVAADIQREKAAGLINCDTITDLGYGTTLYSRRFINADGSPVRARVTGKVRTWVRRPGWFEIPWKHGMRTYGKITPQNADEWTTVEPPGLLPVVVRRRRQLLGPRWDDRTVKLPVTETDDKVKDELLADDDLVRRMRDIEDVREYVKGYMFDHLAAATVTDENVARVMLKLPNPTDGGFPDVFAVFRAIAAAGLGNAEELEREFFAGGAD